MRTYFDAPAASQGHPVLLGMKALELRTEALMDLVQQRMLAYDRPACPALFISL